jgi:hypothetical protein
MMRYARALILLLAIVALPSATWAYGNKGPHQKINELAIKSWISDVQQNPYGPPKGEEYLLRYDLSSVLKVTGESVVRDGNLYNSGIAALDMQSGDKELTFGQWIQEGGFAADEPEFFSALRHFYDPTKSNGQYYLTDHVSQFVADFIGKVIDDPFMDAKTWAITGPASRGYEANAYSWTAGVGYMRKAFADKTRDKDRLFAKAWRACGETMHLMADMTVPAHVRNDAHPYDAPAGAWRFDPYEKFMQVPQIEQCAATGLDKSFLDQIRGNSDPGALFDLIAGFTNKSFFSADTIAGTTFDGHTVTNLNGMPEFKSPRLDPKMFDKEFLNYTTTVLGKEVIQTHGLWTDNTWGNWIRKKIGGALGKNYGMDTPLEAALTQGNVLIPVAVASNARIFDMFLPRVEVIIDSIDEARKLEGKVVHHPAGAYTGQPAMQFSTGPDTWLMFYVNGVPKLASSDKCKIEITDGKITGDLSKLNLKNGDKVALEIGFGGLMVKSDYYAIKAESKETGKAHWELVEVVQGDVGPKCEISGSGGSYAIAHDYGSRPPASYSGKLSWTFPQRVDVGTEGEVSFDIVFDQHVGCDPVAQLSMDSKGSDATYRGGDSNNCSGRGSNPLHQKMKIGFLRGYEIASSDPQRSNNMVLPDGYKVSFVVTYRGYETPWGTCNVVYRLTKATEKPKTSTTPTKVTPKKK